MIFFAVQKKKIVDSLVAIQSVVLNIDLIKYTLNTLDSNYDNFADAPTHMLGTLTFDDVRNKLLVHDYHV